MRPARAIAALLDEQRGRVALSVALLALTVGASVALMGTSAWLISKAAQHPSISALQVAVVGVRFFGLSRGVFRYLERVVSHDTTFRLLARLRVGVYRSLVPLVPARLAYARSGDLLSRLVGDVDTLEHVFVRVAGPLLAAMCVVTAVAVTLAFFDAGVAMVATVALLLAASLAPWVGWRLGRAAGEQMVANRAELGSAIVDAVQGLADLLAMGRADDQARRLGDLGARLAQAQVRGAAASALGGALVSWLADAAVIGVLAVSVPLVRAGNLAGVHVAVVALVTLAAFEAVAALPSAAQGLAAARAAARRVFGLGEVTSDRPSAATPHAITPGVVSRVEVRALSFTYPGADAPALRGIDLELSPGGFVAVVGPSGSGKSTLAHVLLRFWDPPAGTVVVDGIDVLSYDADAWRATVALMAQAVHLFTGTIDDNLRMANPAATGDELRAAVAAAGLEAWLAHLPDGGRTWVGEQGAQVSGGERQRIALARTLLLEPASVLVLDEPTASVDAETERVLARQIRELARTRATLLITHRVTGLEAAREILVLHEGVVVERGTYQALMAEGVWFPRMVALERDAIDGTADTGESTADLRLEFPTS